MKKIIIAVCGVLFLSVIFFNLRQRKPNTIQGGNNATSKNHIADCSQSDEVCVFENGKMVVKKITGRSLQGVKIICPTGSNCPPPVPPDFHAGIAAIRLYTHNPDLKLTPLKTNVQTNTTWYCSETNDCWAVDNETYKVLQKNK